MYKLCKMAGILLLATFIVNMVAANNGIYYNVKDNGAAGDGTTLDTKAINSTIEKAAASGGGTVYFPAGNYLTGSIRLKSNITLFIDQGAVIIAASVNYFAEYDKPEPAVSDAYQDFGHSHFHNSLIWGEHLHDIAIIGTGTIWGEGLMRNDSLKTAPNKSIALFSCRGVLLRDFTIKHGGWFGILATGVDNFTVDNLKIDTNRDGMDIDCCQNVRILNCTVNSPGDDGICLKSSFALGYSRPTQNVIISNCQVSGYVEGSLLDGTYIREKRSRQDPTGRIKCGTESNGGFKNIAISNCVFDFCRGLALETVDGALLEDITISNITMRDVTNSPFFIRLGARMRAPDTIAVGKCRRIIISNIIAYNADARFASIISGIPGHYIEDVKLSNVHIYYTGGGTKEMAGIQVPEYEKSYPEPYKFQTIPAYGFFIRHVKNIELNDVDIRFLNDDYRPALILQDVIGASCRNIRVQKLQNVAAFRLDNVQHFSINDSPQFKNRQIKLTQHTLIN